MRKHFNYKMCSKQQGKRRFHSLLVLSVTLLFTFFPTLKALGQSQQLSLSVKDMPITEVFKVIKERTNMTVVYSTTDINPEHKVTLKADNKSLNQLMDDVLKGLNLDYTLENNYIVLSVKKPKANTATQGKDITVNGTVTDEAGDPLIGVNVMVKGQTVGTITDFDGNYTLMVPAGSNELVFSYVGYLPQIVPVNQRTNVSIKMREDTKILDEVVVTAMGIKREAKSLTYATQTVGGEELTRAKDANFINALQGKSAGLTIVPNAGGAGAASKILLRGYTSISGDNTPLIVVDGMPMQNRVDGKFGSDGGYTMAYSARTEGSDALSNINPDDIESITVLKGANAAALYGEGAGNGVLIITTKKGKEGSIRVDVSSSTTFETPLTLPKLQNTYGGTVKSDGKLTGDSWGKPLSQMTAAELALDGVANSPYDIADFFRTGSNFNNSVSLSGGTEKIQSYFSYGSTLSNGIMPNNNFNRNSVAFRQSYNLFNNRLKIDVSGNYVHQKVENQVSGGTVYNPLYNLYLAPRNLDMDYYKNFESEGEWLSEPIGVLAVDPDTGKIVYTTAKLGSADEKYTVLLKGPKQNWFTDRGAPGENNPYWLSNRSTNEKLTQRFWGSVGATLTIMNGLNAQARFKFDKTHITTDVRKYATTVKREGTMIDRGDYEYTVSDYQDLFADFMLNFNRKFNDFTVTANTGVNLNTKKGSDIWLYNNGPTGQAYYLAEDIEAGKYPTTINYFYPHVSKVGNRSYNPTSNWTKAFFATASLGYKDFAYIDGSYRMDWSRTYTQFEKIRKLQGLDKVRPWYPYYSVGGNILLNNIVNMGSQVDLFKVRLSYSDVGNSLPNNLLVPALTVDPQTGSVTAVDVSNFIPKPESTRSTELGLDMAFFRNTLDMNVTLYNAISVNQLLVTTSSVGQRKPVNAGKIRNRGIELTANYTLIPNRNFYWKTGINVSFNDNKILKVNDKSGNLDTSIGTASNMKVRFIEGGSYGDIYWKDFARYNKFDEEAGLGKEGDIKLDANGNPSLASRMGYETYLGNVNAKTRLGWHNTFNYKDFSLYFLIDGKIGGKVISFTEAYLDARGVSERSGKARSSNLLWTDAQGNSHPAVVMPDGNLAGAENYYKTVGEQIFMSEYVYDATNFRLREISLGYTFRKLPGFIKSANVSLVARNLFFLYKDAPVDPDVSQSTANGLGNVDIFTLPSTRSYGLNIKLSF